MPKARVEPQPGAGHPRRRTEAGAAAARLTPLQAAAEASAVAARLGGLGRLVLQRERSKNPRRRDGGAYDVGGAKLTEHHIVPHARLAAALKKMSGKGLDPTDFMPSGDAVTVRELTNLKGGWKLAWVESYNAAHSDAPIALDAMAADVQGALIAHVLETGTEDDRREARRQETPVAERFRGGEEPDEDWGGAYFEWFPGNIVLGPTARRHDQGDGDKLDTELVFLLEAMGEGGHAAAAVELDDAIKAMLADNKPTTRSRVSDALEALAAFGYTEYDEAQQAHWVDAGSGKLEVAGYGGN